MRSGSASEDTEAYAEYILATGIAAYEATPGNREAISAFAGDDIERAVFYPQDDDFLIDRETTVEHFTVH